MYLAFLAMFWICSLLRSHFLILISFDILRLKNFKSIKSQPFHVKWPCLFIISNWRGVGWHFNIFPLEISHVNIKHFISNIGSEDRESRNSLPGCFWLRITHEFTIKCMLKIQSSESLTGPGGSISKPLMCPSAGGLSSCDMDLSRLLLQSLQLAFPRVHDLNRERKSEKEESFSTFYDLWSPESQVIISLFLLCSIGHTDQTSHIVGD